VTAETLDSVLRGDQAHPTKAELSDQDLADLEAYLASLAGGGG
jgi:cytochrome c553